jgi:type III pantothenate kinase
MLLGVDVGNTETKIGVFDRDELSEAWRMATNASRTADELALLFQAFLALKRLSFDRNVTGVAISSVVPPVTQALREMVDRYFFFSPFVVEPGIKTGMPVLIDNPKELGSDRLCNSIAAYALHGGPAVVVGLGTATAFDAVSADGEYLGGAIAPGLELSANALVAAGAMLKRVELVPPARLIGKSTVEATQSGVVFGYACLIEGMIDRFRKELGGDAKTVLTGGLAPVVAPELTGVDAIEPWLTLRGLSILFERNTST